MSERKIDKFVRGLLGQPEGTVRNRQIDGGPCSGGALPTLALMDVEFDPVYAQRDEEGVVWIFGSDPSTWIALTVDQIHGLALFAEGDGNGD